MGTSFLLAGTPSLAGSTPSLRGYPPKGTWEQSPGKDMGPVEVLWDGDGLPLERTWDQFKYYGIEMGYPWKGHGFSGRIMAWRWGTPTSV